MNDSPGRLGRVPAADIESVVATGLSPGISAGISVFTPWVTIFPPVRLASAVAIAHMAVFGSASAAHTAMGPSFLGYLTGSVGIMGDPGQPGQVVSGRRNREWNWRRQNAMQLQRLEGRWIVVEGENIVASAATPEDAVSEARRRGVATPYVFKVETRSDDTSWFGI